MNFRKFAKCLVLAWAVGGAPLGFSPFAEASGVQGPDVPTGASPSQNAVAGASIQTDLPNLRRQVRRVVVLAGSDGWLFRRPMSEADLPSISCTYELYEASSIGLLLDLLARTQIQDDPPPRLDFDARMAVYLYSENGQKDSLVLSRPLKYEDRETLSRASYNGAPLFVNGQFYEGMKSFLAQMQPTKFSYYCARKPN